MQETIDYIAIRRLQNRYADLVTRRAWSELDDVMAPSCTVDLELHDRQFQFAGPVDFATFVAKSLEQFSFFEFVVLNTIIDVDHDAGIARARMWMVELRQNVADGRRSNTFGVYHDRMELVDDKWLFTSRRYSSLSRSAPADSNEDQLVFDPLIISLSDL
ncbi:MAG: nuclear transport factor 2 family protein [Acidimicrobiales bacterium]